MSRRSGISRRKLLSATAGALFGLRRPAWAANREMKITRFDIHKVTLRWRDLVFLEVQTDAGITGLGEATLETRADMAEAGLRWLEESFRGLDPAGVEKHWDRSYYQLSRWRNGPAANSALSAVDIALWDIEGKRLGVPVWRLLEGPIRNDLRVYHTHWTAVLKKPRSPEAMGELAAETRAKGWTAVKWTILMGGTEAARIAGTVAELAAVRKAVGDSMDLCLEAAETFTPRSAAQFAEAIAPYHPLFLEEPTLRENPDGLGEVAAKSPVPIATGEGLFSRFEFRQLLEARGASVIQPDVMHAGGITEIRKIANLAESVGAEIAPHQCSGPVGHVASIHAMSVCHNFLIQEWEAADDSLYSELTHGLYPVQRNGVVRLPDGPGLGISVDFPEFKRRYPYRGINRRSML
jgi:galactonate dehydratase